MAGRVRPVGRVTGPATGTGAFDWRGKGCAARELRAVSINDSFLLNPVSGEFSGLPWPLPQLLSLTRGSGVALPSRVVGLVDAIYPVRHEIHVPR